MNHACPGIARPLPPQYSLVLVLWTLIPRHRTTTAKKNGRPQRPNAFAARAKTTLEAITGTEDHVKLLFGRPDIGVYLTETFAAQTEAHGTRDSSGFGTSGPSLPGASVSSTDIARGSRLSGRQVCSPGHLLVSLRTCAYRTAARPCCGEGSS